MGVQEDALGLVESVELSAKTVVGCHRYSKECALS